MPKQSGNGVNFFSVFPECQPESHAHPSLTVGYWWRGHADTGGCTDEVR